MRNLYKGFDRLGYPKSMYLNELSVMSEKQLYHETTDQVAVCIMVLERQYLDCHWRLIACAEECDRRDPSMYRRAYESVYEEEFGTEDHMQSFLEKYNYEIGELEYV